jgi:ubiquinone/menaquinone biosynthesis C-methylase UbiE/uncharacterized protein YbaR (Trm112 family)
VLYRAVELVCPACRSELGSVPDDALDCTGCGRSFPVVLGIPDLRLWPDPYISLEEDRAKARMLGEACAGLDFEASIAFYYRVTDAVPEFQARRFARSLLAAAGRSEAVLRDVERRSPGTRTDALLDLGCGTAPLLQSAAQRYERIAGVDIALRWLVLARKRLDQAGVAAPLVCACAEALPFRDDCFDRVVAESTLEHLRDQRAALAECHRVLHAAGELFLTTPNRRSLGPDPHTGLPAGAWLPDAVTAAYVRRKGGIAPRRRLLTAGGLRALIGDAGFTDVRVEPADVPRALRNAFGPLVRVGIDVYRLTRRLPGGASVLRTFGPLLEATACKPRLDTG